MTGSMKAVAAIVPALQASLGPFYEVLVHDFSDFDHSIVAISGTVTGRTVGGPITNVVLAALTQGVDQDIIGYRNVLPDGRVLKASTIFIRDEQDQAVGCLCINVDLTAFLGAQKTLLAMTAMNEIAGHDVTEDFVSDVKQLVNVRIRRAVETVPKAVATMNKDDKIRIVRALEEEGLFLIKGAVEAVAEAIGVSRATLYCYLDEVRQRQVAC